MIPEAVVQRQLDAHNARDLECFLACHADAIEAYRPPATEPAITGKAAFGAFYATQRFNRADLHAELVQCMVLGNRIIDHERITGAREPPFEVAVVYDIARRLIRCTWSFVAS